MPRSPGSAFTPEQKKIVSMGQTKRWKREREALAIEVESVDPEVFMRGLIRGIRNGTVPRRMVLLMIDLGDEQAS